MGGNRESLHWCSLACYDAKLADTFLLFKKYHSCYLIETVCSAIFDGDLPLTRSCLSIETPERKRAKALMPPFCFNFIFCGFLLF